jgi:serine/threonine protein kinase
MKDKQTGRLYAVKCATEPYRNSRSRREKHHEVMMHERVPHHENFVEFICAWEEQDLLYIQTELCEMSLEIHLHKYAPLPEWRIWDVLVDLIKVSLFSLIANLFGIY